jgi:hypothetical protein
LQDRRREVWDVNARPPTIGPDRHPEMQGGAIEISTAVLSPFSRAAHSGKVYGGGTLPPGYAWKNGELVHGGAKNGLRSVRESHSDFYLGRITKVRTVWYVLRTILGHHPDEVARLLIQQNSSTSASIAASARAGASLTADLVAQDGLAGLRLLNPARTCAALGEARLMKIMPAVVLHMCNRMAQPFECGDIIWVTV